MTCVFIDLLLIIEFLFETAQKWAVFSIFEKIKTMKNSSIIICLLLFSLIYSQEIPLKCFATIIPAYEDPQIQREYKNFEVKYEFKNGVNYKSKFPICISEMLFKKDGNISAYKIFFDKYEYYASAESFKLKDSIAQINRYKNLSLDSIQYFKNSGNEIQKNNYSKYLQNIKNILIKKYGAKNAPRIINNEVWIGMTEKMLLESRGKPTTINYTETAYSYSKQYIYESLFSGTEYIYVENGKVTAMQY